MAKILLLLVLLSPFLTVPIDGSGQYKREYNSVHYTSQERRDTRINKPENLTLTVLSASELTATWLPPSAGPTPKNYRVTLLSEEPPIDDIALTTSYEFKKLLPCTAYTVEVLSVHANGTESDASSERATTGQEAPPRPRNLKFTAINAKDVGVMWEEPQHNCKIENYNLKWSWKPLWGLEEEGEDEANTTILVYNIENLTPYSNISVCIAASTGIGYGPSACVWDTTKEDKPSAPKLLDTTSGFGSSLVTWDPPATANGIIKGYKIYWKTNTSIEGNLDVGDVTMYNLPLTPCEAYNMTVAAKTIDFGPLSNASEVTIFNNEKPVDVQCSVNGSIWRVTWRDNYTCPVDQYEIFWESLIIWSNVQDSDMILLHGTMYEFEREASANARYNVCIGAVGNSTERGEVECCQTETEEGIPGKPVLQSVTDQGKGKVHLTWKAPEEQNGLITSYRITWTTSSNSEVSNIIQDETTLEADIDLQVCETYDITVAASTSKGFGEESQAKNITLKNYVLADEVRCTAGSDRTVTVSWKTAVSNCSDSGYRINYNWTSLWSSDKDSQNPEVGSGISEFIIPDVVPYSQLHSCVGMRDLMEDGACCTILTDQEVPGPPQKLNCSEVTDTAAKITWQNPKEINGIIENWLISWTSGESDKALGSQSLSYNISNLTLATNYNVTLKATTAAGTGAGSTCSMKTKNKGNGISHGISGMFMVLVAFYMTLLL